MSGSCITAQEQPPCLSAHVAPFTDSFPLFFIPSIISILMQPLPVARTQMKYLRDGLVGHRPVEVCGGRNVEDRLPPAHRIQCETCTALP